MTPEETRARVLHRDGLMLVLDKPAGLPVHRGPKGGASLEDDFAALRYGLPRNPALAHRLDRETAGCLVLGRHHKALEKLGLLFKQGKILKTYWAVVDGGPDADEGAIDLRARPARRDARLVDEGRSERPAGADAVEGPRPRRLAKCAGRLARTRAEDRTNASVAGPLRVPGLADLRRPGLRPPRGPPLAASARRKSLCRSSKAGPPVAVEAPAPAAHARDARGLRASRGDSLSARRKSGRRFFAKSARKRYTSSLDTT